MPHKDPKMDVAIYRMANKNSKLEMLKNTKVTNNSVCADAFG